MSKFEDHLWREFVHEHGDDLAQLSRPATRQSDDNDSFMAPSEPKWCHLHAGKWLSFRLCQIKKIPRGRTFRETE